MKKYTLTIAAVLALGVLAVAPYAFAQRGRHEEGFGHRLMLGHLQHARQALGLSDAQVTQIEAILAELKTQNSATRESLHGGMHSVIQTLINDPNDIAGAQAIVDQQSAAERAMKTNMLNAASKALNVLTNEQRAKFGTLVQERKAKRAVR